MEYLNNVLHELGISKVKLAKYLGVSRQMVYNYLTLESLNDWPKEKKVLLLQLLDVKDLTDEVLKKIVVDTEYLMGVESRLNTAIKNASDIENYFDVSGLTKEGKNTLIDITYVIKEILMNDKNDKNIKAIKYLHYLLQTIENVPEVRYIFAYMAKTNGFITPDEFAFNEEKQFIFEGILYSALTLYTNGGASKRKIAEIRKRFVQEIEQKTEDKLTRTQQLFAVKEQALKELGYSEMTGENSAEVLEKIAEIESRKVIMENDTDSK